MGAGCDWTCTSPFRHARSGVLCCLLDTVGHSQESPKQFSPMQRNKCLVPQALDRTSRLIGVPRFDPDAGMYCGTACIGLVKPSNACARAGADFVRPREDKNVMSMVVLPAPHNDAVESSV
jgi:hypothetical protein